MKHVDSLSPHAIIVIQESDIVLRFKEPYGQYTELKVILEMLEDRPFEDYYIRKRHSI